VALAINKKLLKITLNLSEAFQFVYDIDTQPQEESSSEEETDLHLDDRGGELSPRSHIRKIAIHNMNSKRSKRSDYNRYMSTINDSPIYWPLLSDATIQKMPKYALLDRIEVMLFAYTRTGKTEEYFLRSIAKNLGVGDLTHKQLVKRLRNVVVDSWNNDYDDIRYETIEVSNKLLLKELVALYDRVKVTPRATGKLTKYTKDAYLNYLYLNSNSRI
jgi:hypothetical protein